MMLMMMMMFMMIMMMLMMMMHMFMMIICVSHVTPPRPCHMFPRGARATCYPLARVTFCAMLGYAILSHAMVGDGILCYA